MNVKPYAESDPKKRQVRIMFDRIAFRYDLLNRLLSLGIDRRWRKRLVKRAAEGDPATIIDLATGTGDLAIMLSKAIPEARVTGVDISPKMLGVAKRKIGRKNLPRITLKEGDAEDLEFAGGEFEAATVAFGVRNFEDIEKGLAEIHRVLAPVGRILVLEFGMPENRLFGALFGFYFRRRICSNGFIFSQLNISVVFRNHRTKTPLA